MLLVVEDISLSCLVLRSDNDNRAVLFVLFIDKVNECKGFPPPHSLSPFFVFSLSLSPFFVFSLSLSLDSDAERQEKEREKERKKERRREAERRRTDLYV